MDFYTNPTGAEILYQKTEKILQVKISFSLPICGSTFSVRCFMHPSMSRITNFTWRRRPGW